MDGIDRKFAEFVCERLIMPTFPHDGTSRAHRAHLSFQCHTHTHTIAPVFSSSSSSSFSLYFFWGVGNFRLDSGRRHNFNLKTFKLFLIWWFECVDQWTDPAHFIVLFTCCMSLCLFYLFFGKANFVFRSHTVCVAFAARVVAFLLRNLVVFIFSLTDKREKIELRFSFSKVDCVRDCWSQPTQLLGDDSKTRDDFHIGHLLSNVCDDQFVPTSFFYDK